MTFKSFILGLMVAAVGLMVHASVAVASDPPKVSLVLEPVDNGASPFFEAVVEPGDAHELVVVVRNAGAETVTARTYAADAYTMVNGGFGVRLADEPLEGPALWLDYPDEIITLAPGESVRRAFTVNVPGTARAGEYLAAVVVQNADPIAVSGDGITLAQVQRTAIAVALSIPGDRTATLAIGEPEHRVDGGRSTIAFPVINEGNAHATPTGEMVLSDLEGNELVRVPLSLGTFYAGMPGRVEVQFDGMLEPGRYHASLVLSYADHRTAGEGAFDVVAELPNAAPSAAEGGENVSRPVPVPASGAPSGAAAGNGSDAAIPAAVAVIAALGLLVVGAHLWIRRSASVERRRAGNRRA
ncbi:MAG: hypothetical protein Kow0010_22410 [Dehalococcoidia bacterium]